MLLKVYNSDGKEVKNMEWKEHPSKIGDASFLHQVVTGYLSAERQGNAFTKTRGEVRGGGKKPWRQKGLGKARAGSIRSPLWVGGGVVFGPKPRSYDIRLTKQLRQRALRSILEDRMRSGSFKLITSIDLKSPKTKLFVEFLKKFQLDPAKGHVLCVIGKKNEGILRASRNLANVSLRDALSLNAKDVALSSSVLLTDDALTILKGRLGYEKN